MGELLTGNLAKCGSAGEQFSPRAKPDRFDEAFEGLTADTPELKAECFRIRYQVYCIEQGFEDPGSSPGLEMDRYDEQSVHALLMHRRSGLAVGTIRLVLQQEGERDCLPIHHVCQDPRVRDPAFLPPETTAEVSRLAVAKLVRGQVAISSFESAETGPISSSRILALGLVRMAVELAVARGVQYFCAVMEPSLRRMLSRCGIHFEALGPLVRYHGWRQPCYIPVSTMIDRVHAERPDVWAVITDRGRLHVPRLA